MWVDRYKFRETLGFYQVPVIDQSDFVVRFPLWVFNRSAARVMDDSLTALPYPLRSNMASSREPHKEAAL